MAAEGYISYVVVRESERGYSKGPRQKLQAFFKLNFRRSEICFIGLASLQGSPDWKGEK
jgi:hypothetical protein